MIRKATACWTLMSCLVAILLLSPLPPAAQAADTKTAENTLQLLPVKGRAPKTGYARSQFGQAWKDVDRNGCDTRNDILNRDLTDKKFKPRTNNCKVLSGKLEDPYTDRSITFKQGRRTSEKVQIDHVVSLSNAWQTGAQQLSTERREQFANDPYNLLAVDGQSNQKKKDGDAATWLPKNKKYRCNYVARQIGVKQKYDLWVTKPEKKAMSRILESCPAQPIPQDPSSPAEPASTTPPAPAPAPATTPVPEPAPRQEFTPPAPPAPAPEPVPDANVYYQNCTAVRAAGRAPLYSGQPGYRPALDRDHDGIACE